MWPWQQKVPALPPPKVGGTRAPAEVHRIDFTKPHDFYFRFGHESSEPTVFRRCVLVGFSTPDDPPKAHRLWEEHSHNRWLVLRREDGRLAYASRDNLLYIEEPEKA